MAVDTDTAVPVGDCRVSVDFGDHLVLRYRADRAVARRFCRELVWHGLGVAEIDDRLSTGMERLPCEHLFALG